MPKSWYIYKYCTNEFDKEIVADKKPYYFIYNYPNIKKTYDNYIKQSNSKCLILYGCTIEELEEMPVTLEQEEFLFWYYTKMPVNRANSTMNRLCWYIESEFDGYISKLKNQEFDYTILKSKKAIRCSKDKKEKIELLEKEYVRKIKNFKRTIKENNISAEEANKRVESLQKEFKEMALEICSNKWQLMNIVLDLCYGKNKNKYFCWAVVGDLIIEKLKEDLENGENA
jgi:hypothetical protein